jgi:hypothetical protein
MVFPVNAPLNGNESVQAFQSMPDAATASSQVVPVLPYPQAHLPRPTIATPLIQCAPSLRVDGLLIGATVNIYKDEDNDPNHPFLTTVAGGASASVEIPGCLQSGTFRADQALCGPDRSHLSDPKVTVEPLANMNNYLPQVFPPWAMPGFLSPNSVAVTGVHESTIIIKDHRPDPSAPSGWVDVPIGGGTCTAPLTVFYLPDTVSSVGAILVSEYLDCGGGKELEVPCPPKWTGEKGKVITVTEQVFNVWKTLPLPVMIQVYDSLDPSLGFMQDNPKLYQLASDYAGRALIGQTEIHSYAPPSCPDPLSHNPTYLFYKEGQFISSMALWDDSTIKSELGP